MGTGEFNAGGNPAMDWHPIQGGVEIFLVASCHGNRDKLRPDGPLGSYADFTISQSRLVKSFLIFLCLRVKDQHPCATLDTVVSPTVPHLIKKGKPALV